MDSVAVLLVTVAVLVQLGATALAVPLCLRLRSPPLAALILSAALLMTLRRVLGIIGGDAPLSALQGAAGLTVSASLLVAIVLALRHPYEPEVSASPCEEPEPSPADQVASACEEERELLCYDLHDGLSQYVLAAQMHLDTFEGLREEGAEGVEDELALARQRTREAVAEVHRVIAGLSLSVSHEASLGEVVRRHLARVAEAEGWRFSLDDGLGAERFEPSVETMVFRVVQEALTNTAKHAHARSVEVSLQTEGDRLVACVSDDGRGFNPDRASWNTRRLGLRSMCGRARMLGGLCDIKSRPGAGTRVTITVPFRSPREGAA